MKRLSVGVLLGQECRGNSQEDSLSSGIMARSLRRKVLAAEPKVEDDILGRWGLKNVSLLGTP